MMTMQMPKMGSVLWMGFAWGHMEHIMHMALKCSSQNSQNFTWFNGWYVSSLGLPRDQNACQTTC
jgi:hypothetical protein